MTVNGYQWVAPLGWLIIPVMFGLYCVLVWWSEKRARR